MEKCSILGVNVAVTNMAETMEYIKTHLEELRGQYICVSNVHTTVMAYESATYRNVQNSAALILPDGMPLSMVSRMRGFWDAERVTGPDLMGEMFSEDNGLRHFFYGDTQETLDILKDKLNRKYQNIEIAGMLSPTFGIVTPEEEKRNLAEINESNADILWVALGAPKQEKWMYEHQGKVNCVMIGVGAGFSYHAGKLKRAPMWMQRLSLEWVYRLAQDPVRLAGRYLSTNMKFISLVKKENHMLIEKNRK